MVDHIQEHRNFPEESGHHDREEDSRLLWHWYCDVNFWVANKLQRCCVSVGSTPGWSTAVSRKFRRWLRFSPDAIVSTTAVKQPTENVKMWRGVHFLPVLMKGSWQTDCERIRNRDDSVTGDKA